MVARRLGRQGRPFRRAQAQCYREERDCHLCGQWVDQESSRRDPRAPWARSVHHLIPPDIRPDLADDRANMRLAHIGCNSRHGRGAYETRARGRSTQRVGFRTSRAW